MRQKCKASLCFVGDTTVFWSSSNGFLCKLDFASSSRVQKAKISEHSILGISPNIGLAQWLLVATAGKVYVIDPYDLSICSTIKSKMSIVNPGMPVFLAIEGSTQELKSPVQIFFAPTKLLKQVCAISVDGLRLCCVVKPDTLDIRLGDGYEVSRKVELCSTITAVSPFGSSQFLVGLQSGQIAIVSEDGILIKADIWHGPIVQVKQYNGLPYYRYVERALIQDSPESVHLLEKQFTPIVFSVEDGLVLSNGLDGPIVPFIEIVFGMQAPVDFCTSANGKYLAIIGLDEEEVAVYEMETRKVVFASTTTDGL